MIIRRSRGVLGMETSAPVFTGLVLNGDSYVRCILFTRAFVGMCYQIQTDLDCPPLAQIYQTFT